MSVTQAEIDHLVHLTAVSITAELTNRSPSCIVMDVHDSVGMMRRELHTMLTMLGVKSTEQVKAEDDELHWHPSSAGGNHRG